MYKNEIKIKTENFEIEIYTNKLRNIKKEIKLLKKLERRYKNENRIK